MTNTETAAMNPTFKRTPKLHTPSWRPCTGEAHQGNPIDGCGCCQGHRWGSVATCTECVYTAEESTRNPANAGCPRVLSTRNKPTKRGKRSVRRYPICGGCGRLFDMTAGRDQFSGASFAAWSYVFPRERWANGYALVPTVEEHAPTTIQGLVLRAEAGCTHVCFGVPHAWHTISEAISMLRTW